MDSRLAPRSTDGRKRFGPSSPLFTDNFRSDIGPPGSVPGAAAASVEPIRAPSAVPFDASHSDPGGSILPHGK